MSTIKLLTKVNERASGSAISGEAHIIGEDDAGYVYLTERPETAAGVTISGFTRVTGTPAAGEFQVAVLAPYSTPTSTLVFNAADAGTAITVNYTGMGSEVMARDLNRVRDWFYSLTLNVQEFWSPGDADYSTALAAALAAADDGACVYFPSSATGYDIGTTGVTLPTTKAVTLRGYGVRLLYSGTGRAVTIYNNAGADDPRHVIEGITFVQTGTGGTGTGVRITDSQLQTVRQCRFIDFNKGVELYNTAYWTEGTVLDSIEWKDCDYAVYVDKGGGTASFASLTMRDCIIGSMAGAASATPHGIHIATGASIYRASLDRLVINPDKNNSVAFYSDGDTSDINGSVHIENVDSGVTGNVAWKFDTNATGPNMRIWSDIRGTVATKVSTVPAGFTLQGLVLGNQGQAPATIRKAAVTSYVRNIMDDDVSTVRWIEQVGGGGDDVFRWRPATYAEPPEVVEWNGGSGTAFAGIRHVLMGTGPAAASDGDTTPSVKGVDFLTMTYTGATDVTALDDIVNGQRVVIWFANANVTLKTGAYLAIAGTVDYNPPAGTIMEGIGHGGTWRELSRTEP